MLTRNEYKYIHLFSFSYTSTCKISIDFHFNWVNYVQLDESRHADIWSHYLVDPYTWPWSTNGHSPGHEWPTPYPFVQCQLTLPFWDTAIKIWSSKSLVKALCVVKSEGHIWPWKFKGQGHGHGQINWLYLRPGVQWMCGFFFPLLFVSWQSDHFWLRYSKFTYPPVLH